MCTAMVRWKELIPLGNGAAHRASLPFPRCTAIPLVLVGAQPRTGVHNMIQTC